MRSGQHRAGSLSNIFDNSFEKLLFYNFEGQAEPLRGVVPKRPVASTIIYVTFLRNPTFGRLGKCGFRQDFDNLSYHEEASIYKTQTRSHVFTL